MWFSPVLQLNHRKLLDGIFAVCGVPDDKIRTISSAVDKLDKVRTLIVASRRPHSPTKRVRSQQMAWSDVRKEMTEEKGLDGEVADRIGEYVKLKGEANSSQSLHSKLLTDPELCSKVVLNLSTD